MSVTDTTTEATKRAAFTAGLRAVADWLDENPEVDLPFPRLAVYSSKYGPGTGIEEAATFARAPGRCEKGGVTGESADRYTLRRMFGPVALVYSANRNAVCEKRMVTKTVEEWVCPDSLLREADERAAIAGVDA